MPHLSDLPMQALGLVKAIRDVIQHTLSRDVDSDVTPGYPNGAVGGFMRVLASQVPRITENASFLFAAVRNIRDNGMFDDKSDLVGIIRGNEDTGLNVVTAGQSHRPRGIAAY